MKYDTLIWKNSGDFWKKETMTTKTLEINKSLESAPGFGSDSSVSIEQNRRRSDSYGKDFATEKQTKVA